MKLLTQIFFFFWLVMSQVELNAQNGDQRLPQIAMDQTGNFVVVWEDDRDGDGIYDIYMRGFNPDGTQRFAQKNINTNLNGQQYHPTIAMGQSGNFVVVWEDDRDDDGIYDIYMRGFNPDGTERFAQRRVNNLSSGQKYKPEIAMSQSGNFVVTWEDDYNNNGNYDIYMCGFNPDGTQRFAQDTVNINLSGQQYWPGISMDTTGNFVVVWQDDLDNNGYYDIRMRGFNYNGIESFPDITVNTASAGQQKRPAIAMGQSGNFVVTWEDDLDGNGYYDIRLRGFNPNGTERFAQSKVNTNGGGQQYRPAIVLSTTGEFVVVWQDDNDDNSIYDIYARGFFSDGTQRFADITVNTVSAGQQKTPAIAMDDLYNFVVAWADDQEGDGYYQILAKGFNSDGVQRFPDIIVTSISTDLNPTIVVDFKLFQNYPNPFNPSTKINWQSPVSGWQTLKVYDVLGNEVATLVDEYKSAGGYEVKFNSNGLTSGVYFYQLRAGNYVETKKMLLLQ